MLKKILVVGLTCIDIKSVCEYYPSEDEDTRAISQIWTKGGNAANTACILSQHKDLCIDLFSGLSGRKEHSFVIDELEKSGVNLHLCTVHSNHLFPTATCILSLKSGTRTILSSRNDFPQLQIEDFHKIDVMDYDWIHFEGRDFPDVGQMIGVALRKRGSSVKPVISGELEKVRRIIDLEKYVLPMVDVLLVSKDVAHFKNYNSATDAVKGLSCCDDLRANVIICAWGDKGAAGAQLVGSIWNFYHSEAFPISKAVDTLGAGDTFNAGIIFSLIHDLSCNESIKFACELAGKKCAQLGFDNLLV